jgi:hypothetical protein
MPNESRSPYVTTKLHVWYSTGLRAFLAQSSDVNVTRHPFRGVPVEEKLWRAQHAF